jgi:hypothetical protein
MRLPQFIRDARSALFEILAHRRWNRLRPDRPGKSHALSGELIVSLTSYPPRFGTLALTLACLCGQSVRADRIILWIAEQDIEELPREVRWNMRQAGVEIRTCDDIGPYKKLVPALEAFPDAFIVTADDDLYYPRDWLERLVDGFDGESIVCCRASLVGDGAPARVLVRGAREPCSDILPSSGAGILFSPLSLPAEAADRKFLLLSPTDDDLWYYSMARRNRQLIRKIKPRRENPISWTGTQDCALWSRNQLQDGARILMALA